MMGWGCCWLGRRMLVMMSSLGHPEVGGEPSAKAQLAQPSSELGQVLIGPSWQAGCVIEPSLRSLVGGGGVSVVWVWLYAWPTEFRPSLPRARARRARSPKPESNQSSPSLPRARY